MRLLLLLPFLLSCTHEIVIPYCPHTVTWEGSLADIKIVSELEHITIVTTKENLTSTLIVDERFYNCLSIDVVEGGYITIFAEEECVYERSK